MALIGCPECDYRISSYAVACPNCGFPLALTEQLEKDKARACGASKGAEDAMGARVADAFACVNEGSVPADSLPAASDAANDAPVSSGAAGVAPAAPGVAGVAAVAAAAAAAAVAAPSGESADALALRTGVTNVNENAAGAFGGGVVQAPVERGTFVTMGNWGGEDIEWFVLHCDEKKALVLSVHGIDCRPYNELDENVGWQDCSLRKWLNGEFLQGAFTPEERAHILVSDEEGVTTKGHKNLSETLAREKIFLLSVDQAERFFDTAEQRVCTCTEYAKSRGVWLDASGACRWWLRTPSEHDNHACLVLSDGGVFTYGSFVDNDRYAVRPAFWLVL